MATKQYRTIVADPPWPGPVGDYFRRPLVQTAHSRRKFPKASGDVYPLMSLAAICKKVPPTTEKAHLWLWIIPQHVDWAFTVARAWGFHPIHLLAWCKPLGTGRFQASTEYILLARKGGNLQNSFGRMKGTHFHWPRRRHSEKPKEFFKLGEQVSPGPYLEMFARQRRKGWSAWGNEVKKYST